MVADDPSSYVSWNITLDHEQPDKENVIVAGQLLCGKVEAKIHKELKPTKLLLFLIGKEECQVSSSSSSSSSSGTTGPPSSSSRKAKSDCRVIVAATVVLRERGTEGIIPGTYSYPFQIQLHNALPSSMCSGCSSSSNNNNGSLLVSRQKGSFWKIEYNLHVNAVGDTTISSSSGTRLGERTFTIQSEPLPSECVPYMLQPTFHRIESFGVNKGYVSIGANVIDAYVGRNSKFEVLLATRNDSTVKIQRVEVTLIETIRWGSSNGRWQTSEQILVQQKDVSYLPGIQKRKQERTKVLEYIKSGMTPSEHQLDEIREAITSEYNKVILDVPYSSRDTYNGRLVQITHSLIITLYTPTMVNNPSVHIPIRIGFLPDDALRACDESDARTSDAVVEAVLFPVMDENNGKQQQRHHHHHHHQQQQQQQQPWTSSSDPIQAYPISDHTTT